MQPKSQTTKFFLMAFFFITIFLIPLILPTRLVVLVDDALYDSLTAENPEPFVLKKLSAVGEFVGSLEHFRAKEKIIAIIMRETEFAASPHANPGAHLGSNTTIKYPIDFSSFLVGADNRHSLAPSNAANQNTLCLYDTTNLPEGQTFLPIDGAYLGDENYPLKTTTYAVCRILDQDFASLITSFCESVFIAPPEPKTTFVAAVGDLMVGRGIQEILIEETSGLEKVFNDTLPILQNAALTLGNLEGAVTESNNPLQKTYRFKFKKEVLPALREAGFDYLSLANNHCYDYGEEGFKDTLKALAEYEIPTSGAGLSATQAEKFYRIEKNGTTFSIISCGAFPVERSGFNGKTMASSTETRAGMLWADDKILHLIAAEKSLGHTVIVCVHGGYEYVKTSSPDQRKLYRAFCDSGADIVFGSHPHVLQEKEWHNNSLIVYSLGNFLFNGMAGLDGATDTEIVRVGLYNGKILYLEEYPTKIKGVSVFLK